MRVACDNKAAHTTANTHRLVIQRCDFRASDGFKRNVKAVVSALLIFCAIVAVRAETSVEIDLGEQRAYLLQNGRVVLGSPISSGRYGHLTDTGSFQILEKERTHYSSLYGKIVDSRRNTVVADADADMSVPPGGKFLPAPMHYFMRFSGADGMHAGYLPGYPASHGCVRMPQQYAVAFFNAVSVGTPVTVYGRTPTGRYMGQLRPRVPLGPPRFSAPRFDPRFPPPRRLGGSVKSHRQTLK